MPKEGRLGGLLGGSVLGLDIAVDEGGKIAGALVDSILLLGEVQLG